MRFIFDYLIDSFIEWIEPHEQVSYFKARQEFKTTIPDGYTGKDFNAWSAYIRHQIDYN